MSIAIIGGSGLARLAELELPREELVETPYGEASGPLVHGRLDGVDVMFLARHGAAHTIAPHRINYRANLWALRQAGAESIVAVATVGGIRDDLGPGALAVPDQIIDYTSGRTSTFFEEPGQPVVHVDFTHPYDQALRRRLLASAAAIGEPVADGAIYGCAQGPRLETAAEISRMRRDGCDVVGMTAMPEAALARELGLPYAAIAVVANHAAGLGESHSAISLEAMGPVLEAAMARVRAILVALVRRGA